jgi:hypothetical protein
VIWQDSIIPSENGNENEYNIIPSGEANLQTKDKPSHHHFHSKMKEKLDFNEPHVHTYIH